MNSENILIFLVSPSRLPATYSHVTEGFIVTRTTQIYLRWLVGSQIPAQTLRLRRSNDQSSRKLRIPRAKANAQTDDKSHINFALSDPRIKRMMNYRTLQILPIKFPHFVSPCLSGIESQTFHISQSKRINRNDAYY